jgi:hypothetical protein
MILGLPWTSWLLLIVAVGLGLALSLTFYLIHRVPASAPPGSGPDISHDPS